MTTWLDTDPTSGAAPAAAPATDRARVLVVSGSVGAGHDGAARELAARLTAAGADVCVRDFLAAVPRPVAWLLREGYTEQRRARPGRLRVPLPAAGAPRRPAGRRSSGSAAGPRAPCAGWVDRPPPRRRRLHLPAGQPDPRRPRGVRAADRAAC